jgi:DNA-directed RNA polymerase sigma subunit (sigma70/sigma32)
VNKNDLRQPALASSRDYAAAPGEFDVKPADPGWSEASGSDDSLQLYLKKIAETPLLTSEEEVALTKRAQRKDMQARSPVRLVVSLAV